MLFVHAPTWPTRIILWPGNSSMPPLYLAGVSYWTNTRLVIWFVES